MEMTEIIGIILILIGGGMIIYPGVFWWGVIVAIIGVVLATYDYWSKLKK